MSAEAAIAQLRKKDLFGNLIVGFNFESGVLVDYMGVPLSREEAKGLRSLISTHLKKSPADLSSEARKVIQQRYPNMMDQFNFDPEGFK